MAMGILGKRGEAVVVERIVRLTAKGLETRRTYQRLVEAIGERWSRRFGAGPIVELREVLEAIVANPAGLEPYPDNWRASVRRAATLPHYPMVLHRGGFPDGS